MDNDDDDDDVDPNDYNDAEVSEHRSNKEEDSIDGSEELRHGDKYANQEYDEGTHGFSPGTSRENNEYSNSNKSGKEETFSKPFINTAATAQSDFSTTTSVPQQSQQPQTHSSVGVTLDSQPRRTIRLSLPLQMPPLTSEVSESCRGATTDTDISPSNSS